jgi:hypothetical protein
MKTNHLLTISLSLILGFILCISTECKKREAASDASHASANIEKVTAPAVHVEETVQTVTDSNSITNLSYEVYPTVGMGSIRFGMSKENVLKEIGEPEKVEDGDMSFLYRSKGFSLMVSPKGGVQYFNFYTKKAAPPFTSVKDFSGKTKEGISMGASRSKILAVYGLPDSERKNDAQITLEYDHLGLTFILLKDELVQFFMSMPRR